VRHDATKMACGERTAPDHSRKICRGTPNHHLNCRRGDQHPDERTDAGCESCYCEHGQNDTEGLSAQPLQRPIEREAV